MRRSLQHCRRGRASYCSLTETFGVETSYFLEGLGGPRLLGVLVFLIGVSLGLLFVDGDAGLPCGEGESGGGGEERESRWPPRKLKSCCQAINSGGGEEVEGGLRAKNKNPI